MYRYRAVLSTKKTQIQREKMYECGYGRALPLLHVAQAPQPGRARERHRSSATHEANLGEPAGSGGCQKLL